VVYNSTNLLSIGLVSDFLGLDKDTWISKLKKQFVLTTDNLSQAKIDNWIELYNILKNELDTFEKLNNGFNLILECGPTKDWASYPNVILLSTEQIIVLLFKKKKNVTQAVIDQAASYVRDIIEYHAGSKNKKVDSIIVLTKANNIKDVGLTNVISVCSGELLEKVLLERFTGFFSAANIEQWINSAYEPLPTTIEVAKLFIDKESLPSIQVVQNSGNAEALKHLLEIVNEAKTQRKFIIAFITGAPGTGKTVLGFQCVEKAGSNNATFLSLNKSLISVVKHSLANKELVHDFHKCLKEYLEHNSSDFLKNIIVIDDAQYSYTLEQMELLYGASSESEADIMIRLCETKLEWAVLVVLIGEKQVLTKQDCLSFEQWSLALRKGFKLWEVLCPDKLRRFFENQKCLMTDSTKYLDLTDSIRSRSAVNVARFVNSVIEGDLVASKNLVASIYENGFFMYITRNLQVAKDYCRERYEGEPKKKYGFIASSDSHILPSFGIDNSYNTGRLNRWQFLEWFNGGQGSGKSCRDFNSVATEFSVQGLELEMPIVCWDTDMLWNGQEWILCDENSGVVAKVSDDRKNAYRVLLTRGRDGILIFIPQVNELNTVYELFKEIGVKEIMDNAQQKPDNGVTNNNHSLKEFFESKGLEVIDKRPKGGGLWIVGEREVLTPYLEEVKELYGVTGYFAQGRATKHRMGWYTRSDK